MTTPAAVTGDFAVASPERGPRPATVTIGAAFQAAAVLLLLVLIGLAWLARAQYDGFADEAARLVSTKPGELADEHQSNLTMAIVLTVLALIAAAWFGATLWPLFRGANVARILSAIGAFAIPGLGLLMILGSCLSGAFLLFFLAGAPFEEEPITVDGSTEDLPDDFYGSPFQEKLWDLESAATFTWANLLPLVVMAVVGLLAVVAVMLVLPPTNRWYNPARAIAAGRPYPVPVYYPVYYPYPAPPAPSVTPPPPAPPAPPVTPAAEVDQGQSGADTPPNGTLGS